MGKQLERKEVQDQKVEEGAILRLGKSLLTGDA